MRIKLEQKKSMRHTIRALALTVALVASLGVAGTHPAAATAAAPIPTEPQQAARATDSPLADITAATARNGVCESGEVCLYYNSNHRGSLVDFNGSVKTYGTGSGCIKFVGPGSGRGRCVKNHAASVWNRKSAPVTIFYKSNWSGIIDSFGAKQKANLRAELKNENAGHLVGKGSNRSLEYGAYHSSKARITTYFDGYLSTPGRHEGVDLARSPGASVYSLTAGTVIYKNESTDLSTISIYNAKLNKSIIYLHTNPLNGLRVGQHVKPGQRIATEDDRGAGGSPHTHIEMRPGRRTLAARSVGDPTLENPIPTTFWMSRGYNICCQ